MEKKKRILIVEDDSVMRMTLKDALEGAGFEVIAEDDGDKGLASFEEMKPDAAVLDIMLPGKSGLDILEEYRATHPEDKTPVYFLTSTTDMEYISRAVENRAAAYIAKTEEAIVDLIDRLQNQFSKQA